jgi:hypothetical protein
MRNRDAWFVLLICALLVSLTATRYWLGRRPDPVPPMSAPAPTSIELALTVAEAVDTDAAGVGSCFAIQERFGLVAFLTCAHVAECDIEVVAMANGDRAPVVARIVNDEIDVGLIWTRPNPHLKPTLLPLAEKNPPRGSEITLSGYPLECGLWASQGLLGSPDPKAGAGISWSSAPIYYGCSGGPVLAAGRVIGVARGIQVDHYRMQIVSTLSQVVMIDSFRDWIQKTLSVDPGVK